MTEDEVRELRAELVAVRERETRLREALTNVRYASFITHAWQIVDAALVVSSPPPGAPLTEPEEVDERSSPGSTTDAPGAGTRPAPASSGSVSVSPPPGERP